MANVAGSLGGGMLVVLQPAVRGVGGLECGFGLSRWWMAKLGDAGLQTASFIMGDHSAPPPRPVHMCEAWPERQVGDLLVAGLGARYGLAPELRPAETRSALKVRLFESGRPVDESMIEGRVERTIALDQVGVHTVGSWAFDGENVDVPAFAFDVASDVARRLGVTLGAATWQDAFATGEPVAAMYYLTALGAEWLLASGFANGPQAALGSLVACYQVDPRMLAAINLLPDVLIAMAKMGADELTLTGVVRDAKAALGRAPAEWTGTVARALEARD